VAEGQPIAAALGTSCFVAAVRPKTSVLFRPEATHIAWPPRSRFDVGHPSGHDSAMPRTTEDNPQASDPRVDLDRVAQLKR